ncbi:hypothetical protein CC78DRAFT_234053 [Lojkania enalia]|uniref:Uncharacterized protein n=1 Tax=Lojkania enalia TaxID=147567 RepID=A0A9P4K9N5_9PLEO|nr:hypothetical protein CC78DRAFT_234053 [Didymosphaeria enalia]
MSGKLSNRRPPILRLPEELQLAIIELATVDPRPFSTTCNDYELLDSGTAKSLTLTCRHFKHISVPYIYHTINLGSYPVAPPSPTLKALLRTLREMPFLGEFCRVLLVHIPDAGVRPPPQADGDFDLAHELLTYLPEVGCFHLWGGFSKPNDHRTWTLIRHVLHSSLRLEHLFLRKFAEDISLNDIITDVRSTSLKTLSIKGVSASTPAMTTPSFLLDPERYRAGTFRRLDIVDFFDSAGSLHDLLLWPASLEHFSFQTVHNNLHSWDLTLFRPMLGPFKESLRTLDIGWLATTEPRELINFASFPRLEYLRLSAYQLVHCNARVASSLLLGPRLATFGLNFDVDGQQNEDWRAFGSREANWIRDFAVTAIHKHTALRKIEINFTPDYDSYKPTSEDLYPWNLMDWIKGSIGTFGMYLEYSEPVVTEKQWERDMQRMGVPPNH